VFFILAVCSNGVLRLIDIKESAEIWTIGTYEHKVVQVNILNYLVCQHFSM